MTQPYSVIGQAAPIDPFGQTSYVTRSYPLTLVSDFRDPMTSAQILGNVGIISNVKLVYCTEVTVTFDDNTVAVPCYLKFSAQQYDVFPNDLNQERSRAFYFTPDQKTDTMWRWQATHEYNGIVQTIDTNLVKIQRVLCVLHNALTDQPIPFQKLIVRFVVETLGPKYAAQTQLQKPITNMNEVLSTWATPSSFI